MLLRSLILCLLFVASIQTSYAQINKNRKKLPATRTTTSPKIDGLVNDDAWKNVPVAKDFFMMRPDNGAPQPETHKTEVKLIYNDDAIYISAVMYAPDPQKIPSEFTNRDNFGNFDFFLVTINPNDDGQNPFEFIVSSAGSQADAKVSNGREDFNWSAVWESAISKNDTSWIVEMKIPYRALRFANRPVQSWGINFHRRIQNLNAQFTWNHIDNTVGNWTQYDGLFENFKDIKPPVRLALYPYASKTTTIFEKDTDFDWSVGMDVKYGITENFTLDATLIPDFSQVGFDNVRLNLGPFEQQFTEQRQFFTEGTELFNKGRLFYSRRIGNRPIGYFDVSGKLGANEEIIDNPEKVQMLNAIKISGRTKDGWGLGLFNAITEKTEAKIQNTNTKEVRKVTTNPFANYNIAVVDKQFNGNSSLTLINTNVTRVGDDFRDANATGLLWHIQDKTSTYNIDGSFKMTNISDDPSEPHTGYTFDTSIGKHSGKWAWEIGYNFEDKNYNPNDLGILFSNNEQVVYGNFRYRLLKPKGFLNNGGINLNYNAQYLHHDGTYTGAYVGLNFWANTKKRFNFGGNINFNLNDKDFFEPRQGSTSGIFFKQPRNININTWGNTDDRKKLRWNYFVYRSFISSDYDQSSFGFNISPSYRFNSQFSMSYRLSYDKTKNGQGYITKVSANDVANDNTLAPFQDDIIFGQRDWTSYDNSLSGRYNFSTNSSLSLTFRHNWSKVPYNNFYKLNTSNGQLETSAYDKNHDVNFNNWNLDLNYVWQFAPGSQIIAFYRHSLSGFNNNARQSFFENLDKLFDESHKHTFSLRFVYFVDYNKLKNLF